MDLLARADAEYQTGRYKRSLALYRSLAEQDTDNPQAHLGMAKCLYRIGRLAETTEECKLALASDDAMAKAHLLLAFVHFRRGDPALAEQELLKAIELDPSDSEAQSFSGALLVLNGKTSESIAPLKKALELDGRNWHAHYWIARSASLQGLHKEALRSCLMALRLRRSAPVIYLLALELLVVFRVWAAIAAMIMVVLAYIYRSPWLLALGLSLPVVVGCLAIARRKWVPAILAWSAVILLGGLYILPFIVPP